MRSPKAWAQEESDVQRAFFSYAMRRFQRNPQARYGSYGIFWACFKIMGCTGILVDQ